jgi:hypothetical protein
MHRKETGATTDIHIHTHLGRWDLHDEPAAVANGLLRRMDELGIEKAVVLPLALVTRR